MIKESEIRTAFKNLKDGEPYVFVTDYSECFMLRITQGKLWVFKYQSTHLDVLGTVDLSNETSSKQQFNKLLQIFKGAGEISSVQA